MPATNIDMHVHSSHSFDGRMDFDTLFATALTRGLSGVAVCDHNCFDGSRRAEAYRASRPEYRDFLVVPACEYATDRGHMLAYFIQTGAEEAGVPRLPDGRFPLPALSAFVRAQGGLFVAAHPLRHRKILPADILPYIDGVETHNARQLAYDGPPCAETWGAFLGLPIRTGGSDAHGRREVGRAYMSFSAKTLTELKTELYAGRGVPDGRATALTLQALYKLWGPQTGWKGRIKSLARVPLFMARDVKRMIKR